MTWSPNQQVALAITPKVSAFLSFIGSTWIVIQVMFDASKRIDQKGNVFSRILFGMSLFEAFESIWNFGSTWPIPRGTEGVFGASGTTQTCTAQGFFLQLGLAVPVYNASLSIYYLLKIKYNVSDDVLRLRVEPYLHAVSIVFPLATCITCLALDLFNNANLWCWIAPYPLDCAGSGIKGHDDPCIRGDNAWKYRWGFYFVPLWLCIVTVIVNMALVYRFVRSKDERTLKYRRPRVHFGEETTVHYAVQNNESRPSSARRGSNLELMAGSSGALSVPDMSSSMQLTDTDSKAVTATDACDSESVASQDTRQSARSVVSSRVREWREQRIKRMNDLRRSHEVWQQAFWYTFAFLWTHLFSTINRSLQLSIGHTFFPLLLLHSFFDPFQGKSSFYEGESFPGATLLSLSPASVVQGFLTFSFTGDRDMFFSAVEVLRDPKRSKQRSDGRRPTPPDPIGA
jgi:hypothetical protein